MPENTVFFVTDVCVPHVWMTVEEGFNDSLFLSYIVPGVGGSLIEKYFVVRLTEGNYTLPELSTHLETKLNAIREPNDVSQILFDVSNDLKNQTLTISITASNLHVCFKLYTDAEVIREIRNYWTTVDPGNLRSANDIITHIKPMVRDSTFTTGFVNLNHINNVYITSPNLGSFDTLATFSNNVIKKVPVNASYGYMVVDQVMSTNDFLNCSRQTLRTLEFHLRDGWGREIDLKGMYITFSIVFNKYNLDM